MTKYMTMMNNPAVKLWNDRLDDRTGLTLPYPN